MYFLTGGASRDRTDDPLLAKQMLSQLSYSPFFTPPLYLSFLAIHSNNGGSGWS